MGTPFVPDIPYSIQIIFVVLFSYIWGVAFFTDDYLEPMPADPEEY